jgi:hypothetical protein
MMQTFATTTPVTLAIEIAAGRIQAIAADRADATVEIRPADPSKSRDVKAAEQTTATFADGVLTVRSAETKNQYFGPSGSVEVTVQLPAGSHLKARTASCELRVVGRLGEVDFEGAYQQIKVDEAAGLRLTAVDGDVEVGRLTGPGRITTSRGSITVTEATRGRVELETQMGDITVNAAPGVSASLDAGTGYGRLTNSLRNTGAAELDIRATTGHGDIAARSL